MRYKVFAGIYICLVCLFVAVNELVLHISSAARLGIVLFFLGIGFLGRNFLKK